MCLLDHSLPLLVCVHRPPLSSPFVLKDFQIPYSVSTEYCEVIHMQTLPEEFFMCKSATRQKARGGAAFRGCSLDTPVQPYGQGHLCFCNLTLKLVFILYPKEIEGNCLKLVKGTGKKKKKVMFPQNVIMHNSHIQVCVSSHQLLRTISFGVTIPGFAFFPTKNKGVGLVGLGCSCDNRGHDTVTEDSGQPWK